MKKPTTIVLLPRDGGNVSLWQESLGIPPAKAVLYGSDHFDVLVVGAGITGMTTALLLQQAGKKVLIADAHRPGYGTTGGTSAHINSFADTTYREAEGAFGEEGAQLFAAAINDGYTLIKQHINQHQIECDFEERPGYLYAETDEEVKQLDDIYNGALKVDVAVDYTREAPTPVPFKKALVFPGQAQFHPLKYLNGLREKFEAAGGTLLEETLIDQVSKDDNGLKATAGELSIYAQKVIYATHMPPNINVLNFECAPYRSYVIAVKLKSGQYPDALIYDSQEPYHYVRSHQIDGQPLLLIGGNDHKTGHDNPENAFADLETHARKYYHISSVKYRWSSQYYVPVDGFPYIGQMPLAADGIYCATGYNGNGMMLGSIAGKILADLIVKGHSKYEKVFSPSRIKPIDGFSEFVKENADVVYHFVADRFGIHETDSLKRLAPGTGKVVEVGGKTIAAYRDDDGQIHALNPICTHAACIVNWNASEKTWDCPCHGARYDINGEVLTGPATRSLQKID